MSSDCGNSRSMARGCDIPNGNIGYINPVLDGFNGTALTLMSIIVHLKWSSVCVIFDEDTEQEAVSLHHGLSSIGTFAVMYRLEDMKAIHIDSLLRTFLANDEINLNFTILCRLESCLPFLLKPFDFSREHNKRSSLVHFSRWLVGVFGNATSAALETNDSSCFDNVAFVEFPESVLENPKNKSEHKPNINDCQWFPIRTLMWHKDSRGLDTVGYVKLKGNLIINADIFPNENFGFNNRKFIVSILPWEPFIMLDNKTDTYSGLNIDLLKYLASGLNFTYEIKPPDDGLWGLASANNTWSGMVGQLQRKEVDIVAAPIAIQSHRETVMDFTHPYFHEFSAILLKKPDPNATKWRTLIDPFSGTVFLFIGLALPLTSFLLCFFEKYNPFYRKVGDRRKIRGLHHFSDSFWYMYGALLTQGGEHIAASSSGRTLLSCWWIFCIITVAIYSGNFVAFFTVSKERFPIKSLEELVSQDTYKWGTAGGTVYETIFKNSNPTEIKKLWQGIVKFNKSDPSILSSNPADHINKVLEGNYAYVADKSYMELSIAKDCDLAMATADILPLQYGIGLPNDSPFVKIFSEEIISILESGLLEIWKQRNWPHAGHCKEASVTEAKKLTIIDLQSAFYMIGFGIFVAVVSLLSELLVKKYRDWLERQGRRQKTQTIKHVSTAPRLSVADIGTITLSNGQWKITGTSFRRGSNFSVPDINVCSSRNESSFRGAFTYINTLPGIDESEQDQGDNELTVL